MNAGWSMVTGPVQEPITLIEAKQHARINQNNDDATVNRFIRTAREAAEEHMSRGLFTQTWQLNLDEFRNAIYLPRAAPLQSVTTVKYYDTAGVLQTLSATVYDVDLVSRPGRITLAANQAWPAVQANRLSGRIIITYVIGWAAVADIPERIKQGIRMYVSYMDSDREGLEDGERARKAAEACWDDRVRWIEPDYFPYPPYAQRYW